MPSWLGYLLTVAGVLAVAPLFAWLGRRYGRHVKGGAGLALMMLGLGQAIDPPKQHLVEAIEGEKKGPQTPGEPKEGDRDGG